MLSIQELSPHELSSAVELASKIDCFNTER